MAIEKFKTCVAMFVLLAMGLVAQADASDLWVDGYYRQDGTYVPAHYLFRSNTKQYRNRKTGQAGSATQAYAQFALENKQVYEATTRQYPRRTTADYIEPLQYPLYVPENARLNIAATGWQCELGYRVVAERCEKIDIPENAKLNKSRDDWECRRGFRQYNDSCIAIEIPANAKLDYAGRGWQCLWGYRENNGQCEKIHVPENAKLNMMGTSWSCRFGFIQKNNACEAVFVPENAKLNFYGNGWQCRYGYKKAGKKCLQVIVPENARLVDLGKTWRCNPGYKKDADICVPQQEDQSAVYNEFIDEQYPQALTPLFEQED